MQRLSDFSTIYRDNLTLLLKHFQERRQARYLLPLRLFIGLGWFRAGLEKLTDPMWRSGYKLQQFFEEQVFTAQIPFLGYETLVITLFAEQVIFLSGLIMIGQLLCGIASLRRSR